MFDPLLEAPKPAEPIRLKPRPLQRSRRLLFLLFAAMLAGVLGLAGWLQPDERGFGTHEQLGLPPCAFRALTGLPCPSCGMTTSFAYAVRGQFVLAACTNAGGCVMALSAAGLIPWCLACAATGRTIGIRSPERAAIVMVLIVVSLSTVSWAIRVLFFREQG